MRILLHLLTIPPDALTRAVLEQQQAQASAAHHQVEVTELFGLSAPDYDTVLDRVFVADSVSVW